MTQLPSELLIDVFRLACADGIHGVEQRLHLAQVSAYWRAVALEYPTFWAPIVVRTSRDAAQLPIVLLRSGDSPLDVELHSPRFQRILSGAKEQAVVIAPKQRLRLKRLCLTYPTAQPFLALLGTSLKFPALEHLELRRIFKDERVTPRFEAPLLRRLVLSQLNLRTWDSLITTSLQYLDLDGRVVDEVPRELLITILRRCTALRHLKGNVPLSASIPTASNAMPQVPLAPRLDKLRLGPDAPPSDVLRFLTQHAVAVDQIPDIAVTVFDGKDIDDHTLRLLQELFSRTGALVDLRFDDTHQEVVIRDDVGRIRRLTVLTDSLQWNMKDLWRAVAHVYAIDKTLHSLRMRTHEWHGFAGGFTARPPTALTEVCILLRGGIEVKAMDVTIERRSWLMACLPPPRILNLPNLRRLTIVKDGESDTWELFGRSVSLVSRVRHILQSIACNASNGVEVCISGALLCGEEQKTLLDGLADKWVFCSRRMHQENELALRILTALRPVR